MNTYRMNISTERPDGKTQTETVRHIPESQVPARRQAMRDRQPQGSVFNVKVVKES